MELQIPTIEPHVLWGVAFVMWAWEAKLNVIPGSRIFQSSLWRKEFTRVENPLGAFRKWVLFPNPLRPFTVACVISEDEIRSDRKASFSDKWLFERNLKDIDRLAFVSGVVFIAIFVITPIMTLYLSLLLACLSTLAVSYIVIIYQFFWLWRRKRLYNLSRWTVVAMFCNCTFFPPYAANFAGFVLSKTSISKSAYRMHRLYAKRSADWMRE